MFKKFIFVLCALLISFTLISCGGGNDVDKPVEELDVIKIYGPFDTFDPSKDYVHDLILQLTGVDVQYDFLPQDGNTANTKLYLDIAGQAQYHLLKISPDQFNQLRSVGALLDITGLLQQYGPNIVENISDEVWKTATFDGKIYGVPQKNPANNINSALFVRKDIFVDNNIPLPTTLTEFKDALIALKNAKGPNFVPFSPSTHNIEPIRGAFGIVCDWIEQEDGSLVYWTETQAFQDYALYMKELVDLGLVQDGYLTTPGDAAASRAGLQNGTVGVTVDAWWSGNGIINGIAASLGKTEPEIYENGDDYLYFIDSLLGDENYGTPGKGQAKMDYSITYFFSIPKYMEKYAIAVIKWMNEKLEPENFKRLTIGEEGVHHQVIDGKYYPILTPDDKGNIPFDAFNKGDYFLTGIREEDYALYWQCRARKNPRQQFVWEGMNTPEQKESVGIYDKLGLAPGFNIYGGQKQKLSLLTEEYLISVITGQGTQMTHQEFINKLKAEAKHDECKAEVNAWYQTTK
jgi:putative aldouronate transport system substrate-binding protein